MQLHTKMVSSMMVWVSANHFVRLN